MPIAAWDDIASIDDEQPAAKPNIARFEDIAAIEPPAAAPKNVARFEDIASIEPPAPAAPPVAQSSAAPFTTDAVRPVASHGPAAAQPAVVMHAPAKPSVLDVLGLKPAQPFPEVQPAPDAISGTVDTLLSGPSTGVPMVARGVRSLGHEAAQSVRGAREAVRQLPLVGRQPIAPVPQASGPAIESALSDIAEGGMQTASPLLIPAAVAAPAATAEALVVSTAIGRGARKATEAAGGSPEDARLAENIGAIVGAEAFARAGGGDLVRRPVESIIERLRRGRAPAAPEVSSAPATRLEPSGDLGEHQGAPVDREVPAEAGGGNRPVEQPPPPEPGPNVASVDDIIAIEPPAAPPAAPEAEGSRGAAAPGAAEPGPAPEREPTGGTAEPPRAAEPPPTDVNAGASVPFMITKRMEADLRAKGFSQDAIDAMTPEEAHRHLGGVPEPPNVAHVDDVVAVEPPAPPKGPRNNRAPETAWSDVDGPTRRELRRIAVELENTPYVPKNFNDAGAGRGGSLEVSGGSGGAPVYWDIVGGNPESGRPTFRYSRGQVLKKLRAFLDDGKRSVVSDLAVDVAQRRGAGELKATYPDSAGDLPGGVHVDLQGRDVAPEVRSIVNDLQEHGQAFRDAYAERNGPDISTDRARDLISGGFTPEDRRRLNPDLQAPARALAEAVRRDALARPTRPGAEDRVLVTMGATGSGKSSIFRSVPGAEEVQRTADLRLEGTYKNFETAQRHVQEALDSGRQVDVVYVHRDPVAAYRDGVLARRGDDFRPVTPEFHLDAHTRAPQTFERLREAFKGQPVEFSAIDNTGGRNDPHVMDPDLVGQVRYDETDVRRQLEATLAGAEPDKRAAIEAARTVESARARTREAGGRGDGGGTPSEPAGGEEEPLARPFGSRRADATGALTPTPGQRAISLLPAGERQLRPSEIVRELTKRLDNLPINTGRFRQHALGIYKPQEQTIRLKVANDLDTLAHELGHHLHESLIGGELPPKVYRNELLPLGAPTSRSSYTLKQRLAEGQAEFTRHYLTDPAAAKKAAPQYFAAFEAGLERHPELQAIVQKAQRQVMGFLAQDPVARGMAHIDFSGQDPNPKGDVVTRLQTAVVDDLAAVKGMVDDLRESKPIATSADGYVLARLARGSSAKADGFLRHGIRDTDGTFVARSLEHALAPVKSQPREFGAYLVASRVPELRARGMETALSLEEAKAILAKYKSPAFDAARQAVYDYQDGLLEYAKRSRAISDDQIAAMKKLNQYYVPFQRVLDDVGHAVSGSGGGGLANRGNPTKRIKGSGRDIINPLESIVKNTHALVNLVEQNRAMLALVDQARGTKGGGRYLEAVPKSQLATMFNLEKLSGAIKDELDTAGVDYPDNLNFDRVVKVFTPAQIPIGQRGIVTVLRNGEREWYQVNEPALFDAITAIGGKAPGIIAKLFMPPVRTLRAGATLSLGFIGRNPVRDTFEAAVNSRYGFRLGYDTMRGLFEFLKHGDDYHNFLNSGAGNSALVGMDRNRIREELGRLGVRDKQQLVKDIVRSPIDLLRAVSEAMEHATRLGEFKRALDVEGRDTEGYTRAALAARDVTIDFARGGEWTKEINRYTAFFNAGVQGGARLYEVFKADPVGATLRASAAMTVPAIALWVLNHNDPEYKEIADWEKNTYYHIPIGRGPGHSWAKVPKSFTLGSIFSNPVEVALEYLSTKNPAVVDRILPDQTAAWHLLGSLMFTAYMPALEAWTNYDTFRDRNIVNPDDLQLDTALQANRWTSDLAKFVGPRLQLGKDPRGGLAPAKLDHLIYGYGAGVASGTVQAGDALFEKLGLARAKPAGGGGRWPFVGAFYREAAGADAQSLQEFYRLRDSVTGAVQSLNRYGKSLEPGTVKTRQGQAVQQFGKDPEAVRTRVNQAAQTLSELRAGVDQVFANPRMTPAEKKELLDRVYEQMITVARYGLGKPPLPSRFDHPPAPALLEKLSQPLAGMPAAQTSAVK